MKLREMRFKIGARQWDLALLTGISQSKISLIENGFVTPSDQDRNRICAALNIEHGSIDWPEEGE